MNISRQSTLLIIGLLFCFLNGPKLLSAADIYVDDSAAGLNNGTDWTNAYTSLRTAIDNASSGDNIYVASGTYYPTTGVDQSISFTIKDGLKIYGGYVASGSPGSRGGTSILSGDIGTSSDDSDNSYTVVYFQDTGASTLLDGFTITAGNASNPTLLPVPPTAETSGGGIFITASFNSTCSPIIQDCIIISNMAEDNGGGIYVGAEASGAIASPTFLNVTVSGNSSTNGGGLYNVGNIGLVSTTVESCDFNGNSAMVTGGGIFNFGASGTGSCGTTAINTIFRNNSGSSSGGFYALTSGDATAASNIVNCLFYANTANTGGAVYANETGPDEDEGLTGSNTVITISNTIFWGSAGGFSKHFHFSDVNGGTPEVILNNSLVDATSCSALAPGGGDLICDGDVIYNQDPLFISEGTDFSLKEGSPAINTGDNSLINATGINTDYADANRVQVGTVDIGIFETAFGLLPVELTSFYLRPHEEDKVLLRWNTATELDNDFFTVERSRNGIDFTPITNIKGAGTTTLPQNYSFIDENPYNGINYYRLKQTDFDGTTDYSEVRSIEIKGQDTHPHVFPNPVENILSLDLGTQTKTTDLNYSIYDWAGRELMRGTLNNANGTGRIDLTNTSAMTTGMYVLKIEGFEEGFKFAKK